MHTRHPATPAVQKEGAPAHSDPTNPEPETPRPGRQEPEVAAPPQAGFAGASLGNSGGHVSLVVTLSILQQGRAGGFFFLVQ
jgi:hypothetical protein